MKTIQDSYTIIFDALIKEGYSEDQAEKIIADVIEDQRYCDDIARNIHKIITQNKAIH